jgi:hypothetical protein
MKAGTPMVIDFELDSKPEKGYLRFYTAPKIDEGQD